METRDELERAQQAIARCREAAGRARVALERARAGLAMIRAETEERLVRAEGARTVAEPGWQRAGNPGCPDLSSQVAGSDAP